MKYFFFLHFYNGTVCSVGSVVICRRKDSEYSH